MNLYSSAEKGRTQDERLPKQIGIVADIPFQDGLAAVAAGFFGRVTDDLLYSLVQGFDSCGSKMDWKFSGQLAGSRGV
jgi:hypothetical protein